MRYLYFLNPILLFLMSLLFFTARNSAHMDFGIFTDMLGLALLFVLALGLGVYAVLRNFADTYKVMTYIAILWLVYPILVAWPLEFILGLTRLDALISPHFAGLVVFAAAVIALLARYRSLPFSESFQKIYFVFVVIVLSIQVPHLVALALYGGGKAFVYDDVSLALEGQSPLRTPHIVYIVPDRYASNTNLQRYYNFDNSPFTQALRSRGFTVKDDAFANYTKTFQSLGALLNMNYLTDMAQALGADDTHYTPVYDVLQDNQVQRILRRDGYEISNMGNWWEPTRVNPDADENISRAGFSEPMQNYLQLTPLRSLVDYDIADACDLVERQKNHVVDAVQRDTPQFVFWHLFTVHDPYIYDEEGACRNHRHADNSWEERKATYLRHVDLTNNMLLGLYDTVQEKAAKPVIFAIQSDEGPYPQDYYFNQKGYEFTKAPQESLDIKFGIFNAMYVPPEYYVQPDGNVTPINNFRQILSALYGTQLQMLPDQTFTFDREVYPYDLHDISGSLY